MAVVKVNRGQVAEATEAIRWTMSGDDCAAAQETRKRGRLSGPDAMAFLNYVMRTDNIATIAQRVRAATVLLEVGEFLASEYKATGLFGGEGADADVANGREAS
jgi:hypothetical protein